MKNATDVPGIFPTQPSSLTKAPELSVDGSVAARSTFHFVAIGFAHGRGYYSRRASFSAPSLADAAQIALCIPQSKAEAYVLRDGTTGKRFCIAELVRAVIGAPLHAIWWGHAEWRSFFARAGAAS